MLIEINMSLLIANKLTLDEYFLLFCIKNSHKDVLLDYIRSTKPFSTEMFEELQEKAFLVYALDKEGLILFSSLKLGDKAVALFPKIDQTFEVCFAELKQTYPKKFGERVLHLDNARCIELYKKNIVVNGVVNVDKHNLIIKCIKLEVDKRTRTGQMQYMQALPTYLHQKNWEPYIDEIGTSNTEEDIDAI